MSEELFGMEGIPEGIPSPALPAGPSVDPQSADDVSAEEPPEEDWESFIGDAPYPTPNLTGQPPAPGAARIAALEQELRECEWELQACRIRLELAEALPSLGRRDAAVKKTTRPHRSREVPS